MKSFQCKLSLVLLTLLFSLVAFADNISVDCRPGAKGTTTISAAVTAIAKKAASKALPPTTITVTGPCVENISIVSLDNITLQASAAGASISDASGGTLATLNVVDSNRFVLNGFTINGGVDCGNNAVCRLYGNTIQNYLPVKLDSLYVRLQASGMPDSYFATIGNALAALLAAEILGNKYPDIRVSLIQYRRNQTQSVLDHADPRI